MVFNTREDYRKERMKLSRLSDEGLEKLLGELHTERYINQDISFESYHRLASSVYIQRKMDSKRLMFHMQKFIL